MFGKKKIDKSNQQYNLNYNAEDHFSIKQIIIFLVICLVFFFTMIFITVKFGFKGSKDIEKENEIAQQEYEESLYYEITFDKELYTKSVITYNKEDYYRVYNAKITDKNLIINKLCDCQNVLELNDNNIDKKIKVKDGYKFAGSNGGVIYSFKNNDSIIIWFPSDEEVESERFANEIYVKKELYNDIDLTNFDNFIKKNKIEQIYIEKEENIIILENTYLDNFLNSCKKISRNWKEYLESFENEEDIEFDKFISVNSTFYLSNGIEYFVPLTYFVDDDVFWYELDADEENFKQEMYEMKLNTTK